MLYMWRR